MSRTLSELLKQLPKTSVLDASFLKDDYVKLDLSVHNADLEALDVSSSEKLEEYINSHKRRHKARVAYGGYLEKRNIYNRSCHFNSENRSEERNIHLGVDLWLEAESPIYAPIEGYVHSFKNNQNFGDYGPTIILEHVIEGNQFYTLYGHLNLASINDLKKGQKINKGQVFAYLGDATVNGDYSPHLHFQIIQDLQDNEGDYPGVCSEIDLKFYKSNCPDPKLLLKL